MSLQTRSPKIKQALSTVKLVHKSSQKRRYYYIESVRTGKPYEVIAVWQTSDTLQLKLWSFDPKEQPHPANQSHFLCYQVLAVAKKMAKEAGKVLSVCKSYQAALNLLHLGGKLVKLTNPGGGVVWATVQ